MIFFVYIIYSPALDRFYVGYTSDFSKRLFEHNSGFSDFTAKTTDWQLKYKESFPERSLAIAREKQIKRKKSTKYIEWLIDSNGAGL
jgi:putative endonuclease